VLIGSFIYKKIKKGIKMSKQYPECPLYNHATCKELHNPNLCAIVRDDKTCYKKLQKPKNKNNKIQS